MSLKASNVIIRVILCFIFPPLAVVDHGCGTMLLIGLLCLLGWLPATIVALIMTLNDD